MQKSASQKNISSKKETALKESPEVEAASTLPKDV